MIAGHPDFLDRVVPSLDARLSFAKDTVPELAMATAARVITEWGHPAADITHLVVSTNAHLDTLVAASPFGTGAIVVVMGTDPRDPVEHHVFHMVSNRMGSES
uniref:Chalcone/stilbene synthase N-terminal domain-containing protein n=1 Tax=Oryza meridionalis TaxID=40149 RepID=A0A0E0DTH4_9ORYZ